MGESNVASSGWRDEWCGGGYSAGARPPAAGELDAVKRGGIRTWGVIEATGRRVGPQDCVATIYRHPGIDYETVTLPDQTGRPAHIVQNGKAIPELIAS